MQWTHCIPLDSETFRGKPLQEFLKSDHWLQRYCTLSGGIFYFEPPCRHFSEELLAINGLLLLTDICCDVKCDIFCSLFILCHITIEWYILSSFLILQELPFSVVCLGCRRWLSVFPEEKSKLRILRTVIVDICNAAGNSSYVKL